MVLSDIALLGPLDPQVISKRGTKFFSVERQSPLEPFQAVKYLREASLTMLDATMAFLLRHQIVPQHALETAAKMAVEILHPILGKVDLYDLGAFDLDSSLSKDYCCRICSPVDKQKRSEPRRKLQKADLHKQSEIREFLQESEERVQGFLEEFNVGRSVSYGQSHQRTR